MGMSGWDNHSTYLASQGFVGVRMPKFTSQVPHLSAMLSWACYLYLSELLVGQIRIIQGYWFHFIEGLLVLEVIFK